MGQIKVVQDPEDIMRFGGRFVFDAFDKCRVHKWSARTPNLVVNVALQHVLDILFVSATAQIDPWYIGLIDGADSSGMVVAAGDTMASHAGWVENTDYAGDRKAYVDVRSAQSVTNAASKGSFAIDADGTIICGAFLNSAATGTAGTLLCAGTFTGADKSLDDGDTLEVTYTFGAADDGA